MYAPKTVPSIEIYSEDQGEYCEASKEDIEIFARRIGIDVENEQHLLYLAKNGLEEKLPASWKPCYDNTKKSWYYFNEETCKSQWEHPLNDVYRLKVSQMRSDMAMNRIQSFDPTSSRPPRSLPPLKKLGRPPTGMNGRLGPLEGSLNKSPFNNSDLKGSNNRLQSGDVQNRSDNSDNSQSLKNPSSRMIKKPLGLTLTGEGANFLKGSDTSNKQSSLLEKPDKSGDNGADVEEEAQKNSIKKEESKIVRKFGTGPQKPGVKFKLDENPSLNFEISTDENDASENEKSEESETEGESSEEEDDEVSESLPFGRMKNTSGNQRRGNATPQKNNSELDNSVSSRGNMGAGEKVTPNPVMSEAAMEARKETMKKSMEVKLKAYQDELDKERRSREDQIKQHMDMIVEQFKKETETDIKKVKSNLEQSKISELEKVKQELEAVIKTEVDKMKLSFEKELEKKKSEIQEHHKKVLDGIENDLEPLDEEHQTDVLKRKYSEETLKLFAELKNHKEGLKEEQKKQIQQMKDYHKSFIDKLKVDLNSEKIRLQNEHQQHISAIMSTHEKERAEIQAKLKAEQEATLKQLMAEFEKEKSSVEKELREGISSLNNDMKTLKSSIEASQHTVFSENTPKNQSMKAEPEDIKMINAKYNQLENKYSSLKKELRKLSSVNNASPTAKKNRQSIESVSKSEPIALNNPQQDVSDSISDSHSESSFYPSSSVPHPLDKPSEKDEHVKEIFVDNNDRLSCALQSLEILRSQILDIKQEQEAQVEKSSSNKSPKLFEKVSPKHGEKKNTARHTSPVSTSRTTKKKNNNQTSLKTPKKYATPPPTRNGLRPSKSTSELLEVDDNYEESNEIVKEAKEFIRTQKERLSVPSNAKFDKPISKTWSSNNAPRTPRYDLDEISYPPTSNARAYTNSPKHDLHSETESSGVGSLKDLKSQEKKQISKDIEAICSSLSHLDDQMRLMWTVVQNQDKTPHNNNVSYHVPSSAKSTARKHTNNTNNNRPVSTIDLQSLAPSVMSTSNRAFIDTIRATNFPSSRMTASNLLSSLDKELKEFKAAKEKILNQYTASQKNTPSESIQEKTKDLREWLEKF